MHDFCKQQVGTLCSPGKQKCILPWCCHLAYFYMGHWSCWVFCKGRAIQMFPVGRYLFSLERTEHVSSQGFLSSVFILLSPTAGTYRGLQNKECSLSCIHTRQDNPTPRAGIGSTSLAYKGL